MGKINGKYLCKTMCRFRCRVAKKRPCCYEDTMRIFTIIIAVLWAVPHCVMASHFATVFDGAFSASSQGWNVIGGEYQTINSDPFFNVLLIDTTDDSSAISGVYGEIPGVSGMTSGYDLDIGFQQYRQTNSVSDGTSLSIIIVGDDPAKSLQIGIGLGKVWYYDENFERSDPIVDLGPNYQYTGGFYVSWDITTATISCRSSDPI